MPAAEGAARGRVAAEIPNPFTYVIFKSSGSFAGLIDPTSPAEFDASTSARITLYATAI